MAAGRAVRFGGDRPKQFVEVAGRPLLAWTVCRFEAATAIDEVVVVAAEQYLEFTSREVVDHYGLAKVRKVVAGGATRQQSVSNGLAALDAGVDLVAIHDGARPLVTPGDIDRVVEAATRSGAALLAEPVSDTVKKIGEGRGLSTIDRSGLYLAQTPQVFRLDLIRRAHRQAARQAGLTATDDVSLVEALDVIVDLVIPNGLNIKVTTPKDLSIVEALLEKEVA
jgi:2-C-methyl-D-erythritol 4-phosphate cytidylyltransferase